MNATPLALSRPWLALIKNGLLLTGIAVLCHWAWQERTLEWSVRWNGHLLLGVALSQIAAGALALRFRRVMRIVGVRLSAIEALRITTLSMFCHFFVPLSAGADLTKFVKLRALVPARRKRVMAGAIALEHAIGLATLIMLAALLLVLLRPFAIDLRALALAVATAGLVAAGAGALLRRRLAVHIDFGALLRLINRQRADVAAAVAWSLGVQCLLAAAVHAGSLGLGIDIAYAEVLLVLALSFMLQGVPASLVGIGVADLAGTGLYVALGLPLSAAVLLVSLLYCCRILVALIGGLWELLVARPAPLSAAVDR